MIYRLCSLILVHGLVFSLSAQVQVGIEGGAGLNSQTGLHLSIPFEIEFSSLLSLRTGPVFVLRGQAEILDKLGGDLDYRHVEMSYLSIPVLLKVHVNFDDFSAFTALGPAFSYSPGMGVNYLQRGELFREKLSFKELNLQPWEYGLEWEVGFFTEIRGGKKIYASFRYHLGLMDIDLARDNEIFHQGGIVMLGVMLPVGKISSGASGKRSNNNFK